MILLPFVIILAALGAAFLLKGRETRALLVILTACLADAAVSAATARWAWFVFAAGLAALSAVGIVIARRDAMASATPEPEAPEPEPERSPDYCWTHQQLEKQEEG